MAPNDSIVSPPVVEPCPRVRNVAVLTTIDLGEESVVSCCSAPAPMGKKLVSVGTLVEPFTCIDSSSGGRGFSVCCHAAPPTSISAPPWFTHACSVLSCEELSVLVAKSSKTMTSKLESTADVGG